MNAHTPFTAPDDRLAAELAGDFHHLVTLTTFAAVDVAAWFGMSISAYKQSRLADRFQHRFRLTGLTPEEARRMTDRLATIPEVAGIHVEHMISRL